MNEQNTLAPLEYSVQAKRRIFTSMLDQSCAGIWRQKTRSVLNHLDALDAELSEIERLLDASNQCENPEHICR